MKYYLFFVAICLIGCNNETETPIVPRTPDSTVHLAGNVGVGSYWKNESRFDVGDNGRITIQSMVVDDESVVIGGYIGGVDGKKVIVYNGVTTLLGPDGGGVTFVATRDKHLYAVFNQQIYRDGVTTPLSNTGWATGLALQGNDVYVSGTSHGSEYLWGESPFYPMDTYAICWKNGVEFFREGDYTYANTIFIYGEDVYLGGHLNHYPSLDRVACYWKNGSRIALTPESDDAEVRSLFVDADHVYAAGLKNGKAVYWKDGVATELSQMASIANSIYVYRGDVYVAGKIDPYPVLWKNGVNHFVGEGRQGSLISVAVTPFLE